MFQIKNKISFLSSCTGFNVAWFSFYVTPQRAYKCNHSTPIWIPGNSCTDQCTLLTGIMHAIREKRRPRVYLNTIYILNIRRGYHMYGSRILHARYNASVELVHRSSNDTNEQFTSSSHSDMNKRRNIFKR